MSQSQQNSRVYVSRSAPHQPANNSRIMLVWENGMIGLHHGDVFPWSSSQQASDARVGVTYARLFDESTTRRPLIPTGSAFESYPAPSRHSDEWGMPPQTQNDDTKLTKDDQQKALKMLRKEWYNPTAKILSKNVSLYYRDLARDPNHRNTGKSPDDDTKRCAICLEDFEIRSEVTVTLCNHMFHEDCIVPWVRSNGQCPVCRFQFCKPERKNMSASGNRRSASLPDDDIASNEFLMIIRAMDEAFPRRRMS